MTSRMSLGGWWLAALVAGLSAGREAKAEDTAPAPKAWKGVLTQTAHHQSSQETTQTVWIFPDKVCRMEAVTGDRKEVQFSDGAKGYRYVEGALTARLIADDPGHLRCPWESWNRGREKLAEAEPEAVDGKMCKVVTFKQGGRLPVKEWIWEEEDLVLKREWAVGRHKKQMRLEKLEPVTGPTEAWTRLPKGLAIKAPPRAARGEKKADAELLGQSVEGICVAQAGKPAELSLASFKGKKVLLLNFFAVWCGPCHMEMPALAKVYEDYKDKGVEFISFDVGEYFGTPEEQFTLKFMETYGLTWPMAIYDENGLGGRWASFGVPTSYVVDLQGKIRAHKVGAVKAEAWAREALDAALEEAAAGPRKEPE